MTIIEYLTYLFWVKEFILFAFLISLVSIVILIVILIVLEYKD